MTELVRRLGYLPDPADPRDRMHAPRPGMTRITERRMDLLVGHIRDQGQTASCVGQASVAGIELVQALEQQPVPRLSAAHAYWLARAQDGIQTEDEGSYIRSCVKALRKVGCCGETDWPLDPARINERPGLTAEMSGIRFADITYQRVGGGAEGLLDALQLGHPVVFGTNVGNAFMYWTGDDTLPAPKPTEVMLGGHAMLAAGFDRSGERVRVVNSWGRGYGDNGFLWMSRDWFDLPATNDLWALVPQTTEAA